MVVSYDKGVCRTVADVRVATGRREAGDEAEEGRQRCEVYGFGNDIVAKVVPADDMIACLRIGNQTYWSKRCST
jgi:hypothetical protein